MAQEMKKEPETDPEIIREEEVEPQGVKPSAENDNSKNNDQFTLLDESISNVAHHRPSNNRNDEITVEPELYAEEPRYFTHREGPKARRPVFREELDENTILNAVIADEAYIDTADLAQRVLYELKQYSIPQTLFADKILCRSQGTLSDLLRNPRPWNEMKSGKETYRRMFNWLQQPLHIRLSILNLYDITGVSPSALQPLLPPEQKRKILPSSQGLSNTPCSSYTPSPSKKQRFLFTERQKSTLNTIFNTYPRVSKDLQDKIAQKLGLDSNTVANFFMNARRRQKIQQQARGRAEYETEYLTEEYEDEPVDVTEISNA
ncbi:unnamed protein product [Bursaphelenchus xylophilus]|uniref:One cut domain family member n=1 Tax=Bursaphelenchus xylophilus TaxID=6326 RepID=A0A1I7SSM1_BURXY|nr:unnamed protein product [Bursaphelenchus xylophilus]CAG9097411.1 unnamed protein product [Bursaphelenchus xylophilus]